MADPKISACAEILGVHKPLLAPDAASAHNSTLLLSNMAASSLAASSLLPKHTRVRAVAVSARACAAAMLGVVDVERSDTSDLRECLEPERHDPVDGMECSWWPREVF